LDVIEHFPPSQVERVLAELIDEFSPELEVIVVKIPVANGLLYRLATLLSRAGRHGPLLQLYQVGTDPPHYHYFTRGSLRILLSRVHLNVVEDFGDLDFEPSQLWNRVKALRSLPPWVAHTAGRALARAASGVRAHDTWIVIARPEQSESRS
jgi:hypothetical protein